MYVYLYDLRAASIEVSAMIQKALLCWNPHQKGVTENQMHADNSYIL